MVTIYKGGQTQKVWPIDLPHWLADGWSKTKPDEESPEKVETAKASDDAGPNSPVSNDAGNQVKKVKGK